MNERLTPLSKSTSGKNIQNTNCNSVIDNASCFSLVSLVLIHPLIILCFVCFSAYGRVLCTNKRLYVRLSRTGSRKT